MRILYLNIPVLLVFLLNSCSGTSGISNSSKSASVDSPSGILKIFTDAKNRKDLELMKSTLSKGTLDTIAGVAEGHGKTIDEYLMPGNTTPLNRPEMPQTRNEKIDRDIAVVEIKRFAEDKWRKLTFHREDGKWKMDLNLYMDELYPNMKSNGSDPSAPPPSR